MCKDAQQHEVAVAGFLRGWDSGTWVLDGNSTEAEARALLDGFADGDPMIYDSLGDFSFGEWSGESEREIIGAFVDDFDSLAPEDVDELANTYLDAWHAGRDASAENEARMFLGLSYDLHADVAALAYADDTFGDV